MLKKLRQLHATPASNECFHFFNWPHAVLSSSPVPTPVTKKVIEFISLLHKPNGFNDSDAWLKTLDVNIWDMKTTTVTRDITDIMVFYICSVPRVFGNMALLGRA